MLQRNRESTPSSLHLFRPLLLLLTGFACALVIAFTSSSIVSARRRLISTELESLSRLAETVAAQTEGLFGTLEFFLDSMNRWLASHPEADPRVDPDFVGFVDAYRSSTKGMIDIRLVSRNGELFYIPSKGEKPLADVRDRAYFKVQSDPATRGFYIAEPVKSRVTGLWGIPVSYPLEAGNAGISVAFAAIELPDLDALYEKIRPKPNGTVALIRPDGLVLARTPFSESIIGSKIGDAAELTAFSGTSSEAVVSIASRRGEDGMDRLVAYKRIAPLGLIITVTAAKRDVLEPWAARLPLEIGIGLVTLAILIGLTARLLRLFDEAAKTRAALAAGLERLEASHSTRDKLFSIISHDLRGPLGGMQSLLESLVSDHDALSPAEQFESIFALSDAATGTAKLLEELLEWARSQQGAIRFEPTAQPLIAVVEDTENTILLTAAAKGIRFQHDVEPGLVAYADGEMLRTLLRNLLGNAIKYSKNGGLVRLVATAATPSSAPGLAGERTGGVIIRVEDDGIGMDPELLSKVFDAVSLRSRPGTAGERGSGLGLAICKDFAERHGGRLEARSAIGSGSVFELYLPGKR